MLTPGVSMLIGIVTVLYDSDTVLPGFFASLHRQTERRFRLYVIDNSASDSGLRLARQLAPQSGVDAVFKFNGANLGIAAGNNQGIDLALADACTHVLLANNDTEFGADTLGELAVILEQSAAQAVTPKIYYYGEERLIWYAGGDINAWAMRTPHYGMMTQDTGQFDHQTDVGYAPTCFMLLKAKMFAVVGRMDDRYFVYYDDVDFVWRMKLHGMRLAFAPHVTVLHKVSTSTGGAESPFTLYYSNRNRLYFIRKNLHGLKKWVALSYALLTRPARICLLPRAKAARAWRGVLDGLRMPVGGAHR
jgi:GT2 family glycosyltransferase